MDERSWEDGLQRFIRQHQRPLPFTVPSEHQQSASRSMTSKTDDSYIREREREKSIRWKRSSLLSNLLDMSNLDWAKLESFEMFENLHNRCTNNTWASRWMPVSSFADFHWQWIDRPDRSPVDKDRWSPDWPKVNDERMTFRSRKEEWLFDSWPTNLPPG